MNFQTFKITPVNNMRDIYLFLIKALISSGAKGYLKFKGYFHNKLNFKRVATIFHIIITNLSKILEFLVLSKSLKKIYRLKFYWLFLFTMKPSIVVHFFTQLSSFSHSFSLWNEAPQVLLLSNFCTYTRFYCQPLTYFSIFPHSMNKTPIYVLVFSNHLFRFYVSIILNQKDIAISFEFISRSRSLSVIFNEKLYIYITWYV